MLTKVQAKEIVEASIRKAIGKPLDFKQHLRAAGVTAGQLNYLVKTIVADPQAGVPRFQHYLDPNVIGTLALENTSEDIAEKILDLSVGKLCSNPQTPHPQECCPYPLTCPQCGYPVL